VYEEHHPRQHRSRHPERRPRAVTDPDEEGFLALGEGAERYLVEAAAIAAGASRPAHRGPHVRGGGRPACLHGANAVDRALGLEAFASRFGEGDMSPSWCTPKELSAGC
jgi:hypothetical protein